MTSTKNITVVQKYLPVTHSNGERLVQVCNQAGVFVGWADGRGKYDISGTWEVDEKWSPEQAAELGRKVAFAKENLARVTVTENGLERIVSGVI